MKTTDKNIQRRDFLRYMTAGVAAIGAFSLLSSCDQDSREKYFQTHFQELDDEKLKDVITRLEREYKNKYQRDIKVSATPALENTLFGYGLDLSGCIGCRECVYACTAENNQSVNPPVHWIRVLKMKREDGIDLKNADPYYNPANVPEEDSYYMPVQCQHCRNAPCTKVCPVKATWTEPDGIVVVDYNWCIGCRSCMAACPYGARHFNWTEPVIPASGLKSETEYLGNRPRYKGVVEKCTMCIHRIRKGRYPACVEICPVGARKFGNLLDPESEIRLIMNNKRVFILKQEMNTQPKFFYFYNA